MFNLEHQGLYTNAKKSRDGAYATASNRLKSSASSKARSMMNLHNNEAGRRVSVRRNILFIFFIFNKKKKYERTKDEII